MTEEAPLPKLADALADKRLRAVADAYVRTTWEPPMHRTLKEQMDAVELGHGRRAAEQQGWMAVNDARRFLAMFDAAMATAPRSREAWASAQVKMILRRLDDGEDPKVALHHLLEVLGEE
jgi:hypothetical protein